MQKCFEKDNKPDVIIDNGVDAYQIIGYDMGKKVTVNKFAFISHTSTVLQLYKYQLSFADTAEALFGANAVYTTDVITTTDSAGAITFNKEVSAQYFGFKVVGAVRPEIVGSTYGVTTAIPRISHISLYGNPYGSLSTVTFTDKKNNELLTAYSDSEGYLSKADLELAASLVPEIYGYNKLIGQNGQEWSKDVYGAVTESVVVTPSYQKDTSLKYDLIHNKINGTPDEKEVEFDEYVTLVDADANSFKVGESVIGGADEVSFYAAGDLTVDSSTDAAPATPTVTVLNSVVTKEGEKQSWRIFAHAYLPSGFAPVETGAIFLSPYTEKQLSKDGYTDWNFEILGTKYAHKAPKGADGANYAMLALNGISATTANPVTRHAKTYVAYTQAGSATPLYAYSQKLTKIFGE